jgi:hypothetical protein
MRKPAPRNITTSFRGRVRRRLRPLRWPLYVASRSSDAAFAAACAAVEARGAAAGVARGEGSGGGSAADAAGESADAGAAIDPALDAGGEAMGAMDCLVSDDMVREAARRFAQANP